MTNDATPNAVDEQVLRQIAGAIEAEFEARPPTIAVIGLSGVGKSSVLNAMFGSKKRVSATTRGTHRFARKTIKRTSSRVEGAPVTCSLQVIDAPGLGEDVDLDPNYLARYRRHLPKADIALWVLAARSRALALDQQYLSNLRDDLPNLVIGINQIDLVEPVDWDERLNMPSKAQAAHIKAIEKDRRERLGRVIGYEPPVVAFSAKHYFDLQKLFNACLHAAPANRRWMFEILKSFSTRDWLNQARGLTEEQRQALAERYITSDRKLSLDQVRRIAR